MTRDIAAVALGLAVAGVALREALTLPIGSVRSPGQGFFPLWLGVLLFALSLVLLGQTLRSRAVAGSRRGGRSGQVVGVVAALAAYTAMLEPIGYPIATFLLVLYMVKITHPQRWPLALGVSLLAAGGSYLLFAVWLKVPLPPGLWRS
jgi:putative tricarboxylic transport membrane protein